MKKREVIPLKQGLDFKLNLPGSKSITNRAFLCAALAKGESSLKGYLESDDTRVMMNALRQVGVKLNQKDDAIKVIGVGGEFKSGDFIFDLHNAGTATRFLTAAMCVRDGTTVVTGNSRMKQRPISDLVEGLKQLGIEIDYLENEGFPPVKIKSKKRKAKCDQQTEYLIKMKGNKSSQYFSALLMMGPLLNKPLRIEVEGDLVSKPYIDITIDVMKAFGVEIDNNNYQSFLILPQKYKATDYLIEGDASAASYWQSIHFLHKGYLNFKNLNIKKSIQGDAKYLDYLKQLLDKKEELDMNDLPDVAMTLAVTAPFSLGETCITGLSTLRIKETDRLFALEKELGKLGVEVGTTDDSIIVSGGSMINNQGSLLIETYDDHRMAMCFAVMGTKISGIIINNPDCTNKTYPHFWGDLEKMYLSKKIELGSKNLVLIGMRASGKSYFGKKIAKLLGREFLDLDSEIEKSQSMSISEIVGRNGWDYFRSIEQKICSDFANVSVDPFFKPKVIATGGGVILNEENMKNLKQNSVILFIFADVSTLVQRINQKKGGRPSLTGEAVADELQQVWEERRELYLKYADYVWDDTSGKIVKLYLDELFK